MSLPLLSSEHLTTQPSHHFILLTYITVITALADLLCADLEILSLVLPPTHFWFFSDNRTLVSFPDLPPSFSLFLTPSVRVRKLFPNLLSPSSKDYNSSAVGLVRYYACGQNILWIRLAEGKSLNLQKFTLKSGWFGFPKSFCAFTSSKSTSVRLQCRSYTRHETLIEAGFVCIYGVNSTLPLPWKTYYCSHTLCYKLPEDRETGIANSFHTVTKPKRTQEGRSVKVKGRENPHTHTIQPLIQKMQRNSNKSSSA